MYYFLNYKGLKLGGPMTKEEARIKMSQMECCFEGLRIESMLTLPQDGWSFSDFEEPAVSSKVTPIHMHRHSSGRQQTK